MGERGSPWWVFHAHNVSWIHRYILSCHFGSDYVRRILLKSRTPNGETLYSFISKTSFGLSFSCLFFRVFIPLSRLYLLLSFFNYIITSFFQSTVVGLPGLCQNLAVFPVAVEQRHYHALAPIQRQNMAENFVKETQERNKCAPAILVQVKKYAFSSVGKRKQWQF